MTDDPPAERPSDLQHLLREQRFDELRRRLDRLEGELDLDLRWLAGELAWRGFGPLGDAVEAARGLLEAGDGRGPAMAANAARTAARAGASTFAEKLLGQAHDQCPEDAAIGLALQQLEHGPVEGTTREQWKVASLIRAGEGERARELLAGLCDNGEGEGRQWAMLRLADLMRVTPPMGEYLEAGELLLRVRELAPGADRAPLVGLTGALCRWSGGDVEGARETLRTLRDGAGAPSSPTEGYARWVAGEVLATLDRDPERSASGPDWTVLLSTLERTYPDAPIGVAALRLVLELSGRQESAASLAPSDQAMPSMAFLRSWLTQAGIASVRLVIDEETVVSALKLGVGLILEEERPTQTGYLLVSGYDPVGRLLLLKDPRRLAPRLRHVEDQWRRSALHGRSGLALVGSLNDEASLRRLVAGGLRHDDRLDLVDRCDLDPSGRVPSQARVAILAEEAIARAPELPALRQRQGQSLVNQLRMGNVEPDSAGPFERWLSETRLRFPEAEWPFQIYAAALELQGRDEEAGIAWADASARDPYDERNFLGQAVVLARQGRLRAADRMLCRVLSLRHGHAEAHARRAEIALTQGRVEVAELCADLAVDLEPADVGARLTRASVDERGGRFDRATGLLTDIVHDEPEHVFARVRLLRRHVHQGRWEEAGKLAADVCALAPGAARAWETAAWIAWGTGEGNRSLSLCMAGLQRCGPDPSLVGATMRTIATELDPDAATTAIGELTDLLASTPPALLDAATNLSNEGWHEEAATLAERVVPMLPNDPNPNWRLVQILLSSPAMRQEHSERIDELLLSTAERTRGYPHPRVILGARLLEKDPERTLELLQNADAALAPAPVWYLQALALEALGRDDAAKQARQRLPELFPSGVLQSMGLLRMVGLHGICRDLLGLMLQEMPDNLEGKVELARTVGEAGDRSEELRLLLEVESLDAAAVPDDWIMGAAEASCDWGALERTARRAVERVESDSSEGEDVWGARAQLAGAVLGRTGERDALDQVLHLAPAHPDVLSAAHRVLRRLDLSTASKVRGRLEQAAPGRARVELRLLEEATV